MSHDTTYIDILDEQQGNQNKDNGRTAEEISFAVEGSNWPQMGEEAYHGLVGEVVKTIEPHTEGDPVALLIQLLVAFGSAIGRKPFFRVEDDCHYTNLFTVLVGETSKARKGTSWGRVHNLIKCAADVEWSEKRIVSGLSSGEGLIWNVRDPIYRQQKNKETNSYDDVEEDPGISDKRLLVKEGEFAAALKVMNREGNTLSPQVREAYDSGNLRALTKNSPAKSTGAHISIIGHITKMELLRYLNKTEAANGFANRFLWCLVKRSKLLPEGGNLSGVDFQPLVKKLAGAIDFARQVEEVKRNENSRELWCDIYPDLSEARPGLVGSLTARGEAHVVRLSVIYALLDKRTDITPNHILAALAVWNYCRQSVEFIFVDTLGNTVADEILYALKQKDDGLSSTQISNDLFKRNKKSSEIKEALTLLWNYNLIEKVEEETGGRPRQIWKAKKSNIGKGGENE